MRQLWLLRHAKSSWDDPDLADEERPLARRGRHAAAAMASYLEVRGVHPQLVLCSSAVRARQTLAAVLPSLGEEFEIRIEPPLYTFEAQVLLDRLQRVDDEVTSVLMVGHNPAFQEFALGLAPIGVGREGLQAKLPTCSLVAIDLPDAAWSSVNIGSGELQAVVTPRDLPTL